MAEDLVQHEPRVRAALADAAVRDGVLAVVVADLGVELAELVVVAERAVVVGRLAPRHVAGRRDVAGNLSLLLREVRRGEQPTGVLVGAADVDEVLDADGLDDLVTEGPDVAVGLLRAVGGGRAARDVIGQLAGVQLPLLAAAVEETDVVVAVVGEEPVRVGGEPVVVAAVEDDGVVVGDATLREQGLEPLLADEVVADAVLEVLGPVDLDGVANVALVVGLGVLVDLDEDDLGVVEVLLDPVCVDERGVAAHASSVSSWSGPRVVVWMVRSDLCGQLGRTKPVPGQVHLASEAQADGCVEQGGDERERDGDESECRRAEAEADECQDGERESDGLGEARGPGVLELGRWADPGTHEPREDDRVRRRLQADERTDREHDRLRDQQADRHR